VAWVDTTVVPAVAISVAYRHLISRADRAATRVRKKVALLHPRLPASTDEPSLHDDRRGDSAAASSDGGGGGVGIGLSLDTGLDIIVAQLGTLWAGCHFVPLPLTLVSEHGTIDLLERSAVRVIVCSPQRVADVEAMCRQCGHAITVIQFDEQNEPIDHPAAAPAEDNAGAVPGANHTPSLDGGHSREHHRASRVCTFFTSGTTGRPKAVHSTAEEWAAFVTAAPEPYGLSAASRVFVATSSLFDPSAGLTFAALLIGATVCVAPWSTTLLQLRACIEVTAATHCSSTPSVFALFDLGATEDCPRESSLSTVILGGEPMPVALAKRWLKRGVTLINTYGITEATVYQFAHTIPPRVATFSDDMILEQTLTIGAPFDGITFELVNARTAIDASQSCDEPEQSVSRSGELVLRGTQVGGPGRWGADGDADAKSDPAFGEATHIGGLFTGDIVQQSSDGDVVFIGRVDRQVKLNGRRIELGPIEATIVRVMFPEVHRVVAFVANEQLCTVCFAEPRDLNTTAAFGTAVRLLCSLTLPPHLVPSSVLFLTEAPVTHTGKIDMAALSALVTAPSLVNDLANNVVWRPTGWLSIVASCWATEIGVPLQLLHPGSNFAELSGNSLTALRICSRLWHLQEGAGNDAQSQGVFGEHMGVFSPAQLLSTSVLSDYASMLASATTRFPPQLGTLGTSVGDTTEATVVPLVPNTACATVASAPKQPPTTPLAFDVLAARAVSLNTLDLLRIILLHHSPPTTTLDQLLVSAVHLNQNGCTELLLSRGASANAIGAGGVTVLHRAVAHKSDTIAQTLLRASADVTATDDNNQTALHHAARTGADAHCFELLFESWAVSAAAIAACAASAAAVSVGDSACDSGPLPCSDDTSVCDSLDKWGRTPLQYVRSVSLTFRTLRGLPLSACLQAFVAVFVFLPPQPLTSWATANGHRQAVVSLLSAGSDTLLQDFQNDSSLDLAERRAECRAWLTGQDGGACDQLTLSLFKL
jgi:acyl-CoA synthetase (AMP-forming)/AMP-acid ligase II